MSFASWWYGAGWRFIAGRARYKISRLGEFFSIALLLKTLFSPYRQISAGAVNGPLNLRMRAFFDRQFSRFIGFFVRMIMIVAGVLTIIVLLVVSIVWLVVWPLLPISPVIFIILTATGVSL